MKRGAITALALLGGCATMGKPGIVGNEVSVTVSNVWNQSQAMAYADQHCHQYGKAARFRGGDPATYHFAFDCVKP